MVDSHDPLCYMTECMHPDPHGGFKATCGYCTAYCVCDLIAKVRADTLDSAVQRVEKNVLVGMTLTAKEVRTILAAVRGES